MSELIVRGKFHKSDDWKFVLDPELQRKLNLGFCKIRHDFHYIVNLSYTLRIKPAPPGQIFQVTEVLECQEEPLLCVFAPAHLGQIRNNQCALTDPLLQLFKLYTRTPFLNSDTKKPTFLSHDPAWSLAEYEKITKKTADPWVVSAHQLFLSFHRRFYYHGSRFMKIPLGTPTKALRFLTQNHILTVESQQNLLTTAQFMEENRHIQNHLKMIPCVLYHCHKFNEGLMLYYREIMETMENAIFLTANVTLFNYMRPLLEGLRTPFFEIGALLRNPEISRLDGKMVLIDSANKIGMSHFHKLLELVKPSSLRLFGNKYDGGASCYYGNGGNVFLACMNLGMDVEEVKTMTVKEEMQVATIEKRIFQNVECLFGAMVHNSETQLVFDCSCRARPYSKLPASPDSESHSQYESHSHLRSESHSQSESHYRPRPESEYQPSTEFEVKRSSPPKRKIVEHLERPDRRYEVGVGSLVCVDDLALYGKIQKATWIDPKIPKPVSDILFLNTRNYSLTIDMQAPEHQPPHSVTLKNSKVYHIRCPSVIRNLPSRYAGAPINHIYCEVNENSSVGDILAAFKYAKFNFTIILSSAAIYHKLASLRYSQPPSSLFF